jgi:hypothetical protein
MVCQAALTGLSSSSEFVLGVEWLDAGVDLGSALVVDPPGWDPFRQTIVVDAARPALCRKWVWCTCTQSQVANTGLRIPTAVLREPALRAPLGGPGSRSHHCPGPRRTEPAVSQSSPRTTLAEGAITQSDYLVIELVAPQGHPQMITIGWPAQATPVRPAAYAETASKIMRIVARANIELARLKISRH